MIEGRIVVDIPALDRLVNYLEAQSANAGDVIIRPISEFLGKAPAIAEIPTQAVLNAPEEKPEPVQEAKEEQPVPETTGQDWTAQQISKAAMYLREKDTANTKLIKALFPDFGISNLSGLKDVDQATRNAFMQKLIEMGYEAE